jgi:ectoine hydroxylase-related dioxygenase (phytanoyl-CoA dioxygenase family)
MNIETEIDMSNQMEFYTKNGYILCKNFFQMREVETILRDAKNIFFRQFVEKQYTNAKVLEEISDSAFDKFLYQLFEEDLVCISNCGKQAQHLISLHALSLHKKIIELLHHIGLTSPVISTRPVLYFNHRKLSKQKIYYKVDAHQDWRSMQGSLNSVVIWLPLVDIDKELGALEILPGSHLQGLRTDHIDNGFGMVVLSENEKSKLMSVEVQKGDVLLFSSFLIHQSGENITNSPRWSCHFRYNDLDESSFITRKYSHPYIYKPIEELITPNFPATDDIIRAFEYKK